MDILDFVLYTYQPAETGSIGEQCHAYGPASREECQAEGEKLQRATPMLGFMVLPLEEMPSP